MNKKENTKPRAIIYIRVSSSKQIDNESLEVQEKSCRQYAESIGASVVKVFREEGESAKFADRTQLINLLEYCRHNKGKVNILIVWKVDRFARNSSDHYAIRAKLIESGVVLHSATEHLSDDPIGKVMEGMLAVFAEFDNNVRSQRATENMKNAFKSGRWMWKAPIGYLNDKLVNGYKEVIPDPERFDIVKAGLKEFAKGLMLEKDLVEFYRERGLSTLENNEISTSLTAKILTDKFYAGVMVSSKWGLEINGNYEPMISINEYEQIQTILKKSNGALYIPHEANNEAFPLRGDLLCPDCGKPLTASFSKGRSRVKLYGYYSCANKLCSSRYKTLKVDDMHSAFISYLEKITPKQECLDLFKDVILDVWDEEYKGIKNKNNSVNKQLKALESERQDNYKLAKKDIFDEKTIKEDLAKVESKILAVKLQLNEGLMDEYELGTVIEAGVQFMRNPATTWKSVLLDNKQRIQKMIFPKGMVFDPIHGFGTSTLSLPFEVLQDAYVENNILVTPRRIELRLPG